MSSLLADTVMAKSKAHSRSKSVSKGSAGVKKGSKVSGASRSSKGRGK